ncbi:MAG: UDP-N-acetylmuramoyl-L-alanyl-D-glutamate--2,6-diaminopimelate ligase [Chlorobi bacterium]|nr:UDP-N-acetylmuramoyl-L-alanyl-D-glutamate--2,6-diaminopimelate ligase [Chlorobiota bacterium]
MIPGLHASMPEAPVLLADILREVGFLELSGNRDRNVAAVSLTADSRSVVPGSLFVAVRGYATDGHHYIGTAVRNGAGAVICETLPVHADPEVLFIRVADSRRALAEAARAFYAHASDRLMLIGVTGTNGKTTTARLITGMLDSCGIKTGYIGTGLCRTGETDIPLERTTPEAHELQRLFSIMLAAGCRAAVMEVSSHALVLQRTHGLRFRGAVFTNLSSEHLDFHRTMEEYAAAKQLLFAQLDENGFAVFNSDDPHASLMAATVPESRRFCCTLQPEAASLLSCGTVFSARVTARSVASSTVELHFPGVVKTIHTELPGRYNVMNLLEAAAAGSGMGMAADAVAGALARPFSIPGRMERIQDASGMRTAFVDYAHTPDALDKALSTLRELKSPQSRLVVVFGCGGNRDRLKRPEMGRIASEAADFVFLTSDNPRDENPEQILDEIESGMRSRRFRRITGREEAIRAAVAYLLPGDVLLVAGKGHETYQEIAGRKHFFSDQQILGECLRGGASRTTQKESV